LNFIKDLNPVVYTRKGDKNQKTEYGFIAQEIEDALKKYNSPNAGMITIDEKGFYSVRYNDMFAILVKAIQEQHEIIETLQSKLDSFMTETK